MLGGSGDVVSSIYNPFPLILNPPNGNSESVIIILGGIFISTATFEGSCSCSCSGSCSRAGFCSCFCCVSCACSCSSCCSRFCSCSCSYSRSCFFFFLAAALADAPAFALAPALSQTPALALAPNSEQVLQGREKCGRIRPNVFLLLGGCLRKRGRDYVPYLESQLLVTCSSGHRG